MVQVNVVKALVVIASLAESGKGLIADRLLFKAGRMERVLETRVEQDVFNDLIIRKIEEFLDDKGANDDVDQRIDPRCLIR